MSDKIYESFLQEQWRAGKSLADQSDLIQLAIIDDDRCLVQFSCKGLVRNGSGEIEEAHDFHVGIWFPSDYLRTVSPHETVTWLGPRNVWHPNILPPACCLGQIAPGTELVDLIYRCYEVIVYSNWAPHDALNPAASQWARNNQHRFPVDNRPLKRRTLHLQIEQGEASS